MKKKTKKTNYDKYIEGKFKKHPYLKNMVDKAGKHLDKIMSRKKITINGKTYTLIKVKGDIYRMWGTENYISYT